MKKLLLAIACVLAIPACCGKQCVSKCDSKKSGKVQKEQAATIKSNAKKAPKYNTK